LIIDKVTDENKLAPFYGPRCRFRFIMNPNLDSMANRMVWNLDSWVLSEVTSLLFVYVCDNLLFTSGFASESTSKLDSLDSRIRIGFAHWMDVFPSLIWMQIRIWQIEYGL